MRPFSVIFIQYVLNAATNIKLHKWIRIRKVCKLQSKSNTRTLKSKNCNAVVSNAATMTALPLSFVAFSHTQSPLRVPRTCALCCAVLATRATQHHSQQLHTLDFIRIGETLRTLTPDRLDECRRKKRCLRVSNSRKECFWKINNTSRASFERQREQQQHLNIIRSDCSARSVIFGKVSLHK